MTLSTIVHCEGVGLFFDANEGKLLVEGGDLGRFLEYTQPNSVRKQVLSDWKEHFVGDEHYSLERFVGERKDWGTHRAAANDGSLLEIVAAKKGRIFLTESGLLKFLRMTSKTRAADLSLALAAVSPVFRAPDLEPLAPDLESPSGPADGLSSLEERRFRHDVLQQLIANARILEGAPDLLCLALRAAEDALGETVLGCARLDALRSSAPEAVAAPALSTPSTPPRPDVVFTSGWHTMSAIGRKAGSFSSISAGRAADVVAGKLGVSAHVLRTQDTAFSRLGTVADSSTGKLRPQVVFNSRVANLIVAELRRNFHPKEAPPITDFDVGGANFPKLSRPIDLSDA